MKRRKNKMKYKHFKIQKFLTNTTDIIVDRKNEFKVGDIIIFDETEKWLVVSELKEEK
jgi:ribosomal protein S17